MTRSKTHKPAGEKGFTLVELVMVLVILGVLAGIVVFAVSSLTGSSAISACKSDYKTVEVAVETYKAQIGAYPNPTTTQSNDTLPTTADGVPILMTTDTATTPNVGPFLHDQPTNGSHYRIEVSNDGNGTIQVYNSTGTTKEGSGTGVISDCNSVK